jgi:molecular chaperone IbpA
MTCMLLNGGCVAMLTYDFEPLYRTVVGLDTLAHLLETMSPSGQALDGGPPYDIQSDGEDHYRITLNVAGFGCSDLAIETQENWLVVRGKKAAPERSPAISIAESPATISSNVSSSPIL